MRLGFYGVRGGVGVTTAAVTAAKLLAAQGQRVALYDVKQIRKARKAIFHAFKLQIEESRFGFVEILSACPTNLHQTPVQSQRWVAEEMTKTFPLGVFKGGPDAG